MDIFLLLVTIALTLIIISQGIQIKKLFEIIRKLISTVHKIDERTFHLSTNEELNSNPAQPGLWHQPNVMPQGQSAPPTQPAPQQPTPTYQPTPPQQPTPTYTPQGQSAPPTQPAPTYQPTPPQRPTPTYQPTPTYTPQGQNIPIPPYQPNVSQPAYNQQMPKSQPTSTYQPAPQPQPAYNQQMPKSQPTSTYQPAPQPQPAYNQQTQDYKPQNTDNKSENWVGIKLLNRLGALFIVIGCIAIAAYTGFPTVLRSGVLLALAGAWIAVGEILNRKNRTAVSLGVSAVGVALSYVWIFASYFTLDVMGKYPALLACIVATAVGIYIAVRHNAQVIGCFALIGGYLPIFALDPLDKPLLGGLLVYFLLLNIFALGTALRKKWTGMYATGVILNFPSIIYLVVSPANENFVFAYACFSAFVYTVLPLISAHREKEEFTVGDITLLIINTVLNSLLIYSIAGGIWESLKALSFVSLAFMLVYGTLIYISTKLFTSKGLINLFESATLASGFLFVMFCFNDDYIAIPFMVYATLCFILSIFRNNHFAMAFGIISQVASLLTLRFVNGNELTISFTICVLLTLFIFGMYIYKGQRNFDFAPVYKVFSIFFTTFYLWHLAWRLCDSNNDESAKYNQDPYLFVLCALACLVMAFIALKWRLIKDRATAVSSIILQVFSLIFIFLAYYDNRNLTNFHYKNGMDYSDLQLQIVTLITFLLLLGAFAYAVIYKRTYPSDGATVYKNINILTLWGGSVATLSTIFTDMNSVNHFYLSVSLTLAFFYGAKRIPLLADNGLKYISICVQGLTIFVLFVYNMGGYTQNINSLILSCIAQGLAIASLYDIVKLLEEKSKSKFTIVYICGYFLLVLTQGLTVRADMSFTNAVISIIYGVMAFVWIIAGFKLRNKSVRKAGLTLAIASCAKLLVIDTWGLSTGMRIISYISLGVLLFGISFFYQYLSKQQDDDSD